jgi:hypothetical protein
VWESNDTQARAICQRCASRHARALLPAFLFVAFVSPAALAQLYEQPVLIIDPGMHTAAIRDIGVDAAGRIAVTGSWDKTLRVWSLADGELLRTIRMPAGAGRYRKNLRGRGASRWRSRRCRRADRVHFRTRTINLSVRNANRPNGRADYRTSRRQ